MPQDIVATRTGAVLRLQINRPKVMNACRQQTLAELNNALGQGLDDPTLRVVIISGAGDRAFCAGADLKEMAALASAVAIREVMKGWWALIDRLHNAPKPVIAAVRGHAVGGGTEIALACHITIAGQSATFGLPEIRRGHIPGAGGTALLPRRIGYGPGIYYLLTGDDIPASEAQRLGLVAKMVPDDRLENAVTAVADRLCEMAPGAVRGMLAVLARSRDLTTAEAIEVEREICAGIRGNVHFVEGIAAFVDKRAPDYDRSVDGERDQ